MVCAARAARPPFQPSGAPEPRTDTISGPGGQLAAWVVPRLRNHCRESGRHAPTAAPVDAKQDEPACPVERAQLRLDPGNGFTPSGADHGQGHADAPVLVQSVSPKARPPAAQRAPAQQGLSRAPERRARARGVLNGRGLQRLQRFGGRGPNRGYSSVGVHPSAAVLDWTAQVGARQAVACFIHQERDSRQIAHAVERRRTLIPCKHLAQSGEGHIACGPRQARRRRYAQGDCPQQKAIARSWIRSPSRAVGRVASARRLA